jgi:hypothetical protein
VGYQVHLEEPGPCIRPVGERANGDLPFQQRPGFGRADATPRLDLLAAWLECPIDGRGAHPCDTRLDRDRELAECLAPT